MVAGRKITGDDEIPDLGVPMSGQGRAAGRSGVTPKTTGSLAPKRSATPAPGRSLTPAPGRSLTPASGGTHSISLEDEEDALSYPLALDHGEDALESTSAGARSLPARPREPERRWPSGLSPDSASIDFTATEIAMTAEYGAPPANHFAALSYAFRVFSRKRALRGRVKTLNDELVQAEHERDGILGRMIDSLRPELAQSDAGRKVLEPLDRVEALANEKRTALSGLSDEFHRRSTDLDAEATGIGKELETSKRDTELARAVVAERQHSYDRVDARKKRLYIEVRAVLDEVEKAGGQSTPPQAARLAAREAEIAAQKPELDEAAHEVEVARAALATAETAGKELLRRARDVERRRALLATEAQRQIGAQSRGVNEAETHRSDAAVEAACAVLLARGRIVDVPAATLDAISRADDTVAGRARDLERHVRAIDAHDADGLKKGVMVGSAIVFVVAMLLLFAIGH